MRVRKINALYIAILFILSFFVFNFANADSGVIDTSNNDNQAKVCHNVACDDFGIINFELTNDTVVIDSDNGISGKVWGDELGWITMNPTGAGVTFANADTGALTGKAWSQVSGWINFAPTGEGVTIDPDTGRFSGYAWSGGAYGGWIKFDCSDDSTCVRTTWRNTSHCSSGCGNPIDVCANIPGNQTEVPYGYYPYNGDCLPFSPPPGDQCANIAGFQAVVPSGMHVEPIKQCVPNTNPDLCPNISGDQTSVPSGKHIDSSGDCVDDTSGGGGGGDTPPPPPPPPDGYNPIIPTIPTTPHGGGGVTGVIDTIIHGGTVAVFDLFNKLSLLISSSDIKLLSKIFSTLGLFSGGIALFGLADVGLNLFRLWSMFLYGMGFKKRNRPWGVVYDSVTKQPLDPAYVVLKDIAGTEVATCITDLDGRYGFLVPPGVYTIVASKTHYEYPSKKLFGRTGDELYNDLYFGGQIEVKQEGDVIAKNIPLDRIGFDWNEFAKKEQKRMKFYHTRDVILARISDIFFYIGFFVSVLVLFIVPGPYNIVIFVLYLILLALRSLKVGGGKKGSVVSAVDGMPLSYGILRVFGNGGQEISHRVIDKFGNYYCLVPNGYYSVLIEKKNEDSSYSGVFSTNQVEVKGGILKRDFKI